MDIEHGEGCGGPVRKMTDVLPWDATALLCCSRVLTRGCCSALFAISEDRHGSVGNPLVHPCISMLVVCNWNSSRYRHGSKVRVEFAQPVSLRLDARKPGGLASLHRWVADRMNLPEFPEMPFQDASIPA
eukprot:523789-Amphidinium_carterae.1